MVPLNTEETKMLSFAMTGHLSFQGLWSGVKLGLFEMLGDHKDGLTVKEIAQLAELEHQPATVVLSILTALGLVTKWGKKFKISDVASSYLLKESPKSMVDVIALHAEVIYPTLVNSVQSLKENKNLGLEKLPGQGETLYERLASYPELETIFQKAMASMPSNLYLAEEMRIENCHHLCDAGGANGRNAIAIAQRQTDLKITIFDLPTVCQGATDNISKNALEDRINTHPGDIFVDDFPSGVDGILYAHISTISKKKNIDFFKRAYDALPQGGRLFVYTMVPNEEETGPLSVVTGSLYFHVLASGEGMMFPLSVYEMQLRESGFHQFEAKRFSELDHVLISAIK